MHLVYEHHSLTYSHITITRIYNNNSETFDKAYNAHVKYPVVPPIVPFAAPHAKTEIVFFFQGTDTLRRKKKMLHVKNPTYYCL